MALTDAQFPLYIPTKSRWMYGHTMRELERMNVPYNLVVEEDQRRQYAEAFPRARIIVLDPQYQRDYDACMELEPGQSRGSGPARNFVWDHAVSEGHSHHWIIDDNIRQFARYHANQRIPVGDGSFFRMQEDFVLRYRNVAMAGPHYLMFVPSRSKTSPMVLNTRVFSCILIRNDIGLRWRARYNEDVDLSLRVLKAGWCTVLFKAFLADKLTTQTLPGGNTEAFYADEGTSPKSEMLARLHPDVVTLVTRWDRPHHSVNFNQWRKRQLILRPDAVIPEEAPIKYRLVERENEHPSASHYGSSRNVRVNVPPPR